MSSLRACLVFHPADQAERPVEGDPFRFVAPLGPIEAEDLAWYLERYSAWPSEHFQERARPAPWGALVRGLCHARKGKCGSG